MHSKTKLLNRSAVRDKALAVLKDRRSHLADKFTRVGSSFFEAIEAQVTIAIENRILTAPSVGKTLR